MIIYKLIGFENYIIKDKIMYRKAHKIKDKLCKFKYISEREIKRSKKNNVEGYYLVKNRKSKFYPLTKLRHRLNKINNFSPLF
jgi:hypothetical protein